MVRWKELRAFPRTYVAKSAQSQFSLGILVIKLDRAQQSQDRIALSNDA